MGKKGSKSYKPRRTGERQRKSVRGCIVGADLAVLNLVITKKGDQEIPGLTDVDCPRRLAPKRASKLRKLFNLSKLDDDVSSLYAVHSLLRRARRPRARHPRSSAS